MVGPHARAADRIVVSPGEEPEDTEETLADSAEDDGDDEHEDTVHAEADDDMADDVPEPSTSKKD